MNSPHSNSTNSSRIQNSSRELFDQLALRPQLVTHKTRQINCGKNLMRNKGPSRDSTDQGPFRMMWVNGPPGLTQCGSKLWCAELLKDRQAQNAWTGLWDIKAPVNDSGMGVSWSARPQMFVVLFGWRSNFLILNHGILLHMTWPNPTRTAKLNIHC